MTPPRVPTGTYRLQFSKHFTFRDAERLVSYLAELGISHIYASPYLKARAGSSHGYDITDYNALNPEIGDEAAFEALAATLDRHGMGQILDFVPNHMGIGKADNAWWLDVLEWGRGSPYADNFDIDWESAKPDLRGKVLVPFLGDHYGAALERGELAIAFDAAAGSFGVWYHEHLFPVRPTHYGDILAPHLARMRTQSEIDAATVDALDALVREAGTLRVGRLPVRRRAAVRERGLDFKRRLSARVVAEPRLRAAIETAVQNFNGTGGTARSFLALHRLLERQAYRLAYWGVAVDEINYRRFFDINELAGVKMERQALFEETHRLIMRMVGEGRLHGLRIDHIDGLYDPAQYCRRLAARAADVRPCRIYLVVEKILARHETLRADWPVDDTTGYEMLNAINGLFIDPRAERALDRAWRQFVGPGASFDEIVYVAKKYALRHMLASELQVLAVALDRISEGNWNTRDFTLQGLRAALEEVAACFPVYRTYVDARGAATEDRRDIDWAVVAARRRAGGLENSVFDLIHGVLTGDLIRRRGSGFSRRAVLDFAMRFQQFTGPVTAKAVEDTAFYRYGVLLSLNEVGGDPRRFGMSLAAFHHLNQERARASPNAMTATASHDTKRGEDARVRLDVLTEMPHEWVTHVRHWAMLNRRAKTVVDDQPLPERDDEYTLYQMLLGAWPDALMDVRALDPTALENFATRIEGAMLKSLREAKTHSSWVLRNSAYEEAMAGFARRILDPQRALPFLASFTGFAATVARIGMLNGLSQLVLKMTVPGVPDVYQGSELWDYNLVDPDNRRPVDFEARIALLAELLRRFPDDAAVEPAQLRALLVDWSDGRIKLLALRRLMRLRRDHEALFREGDYVPLPVTGVYAEHICAFARTGGDATLVVATPRLMAGIAAAAEVPLGETWQDTAILFPEGLAALTWTSVLSGETLRCENSMPAGALFENLSVAVLLAQRERVENRGIE